MTVPLSNIPTVGELYRNETLRAAPTDSVRYPPLSTVLDRVSIHQGDITKLEIDAIVNAANSSLLGGGGVDGAIHAAAGRELWEECKTLKHCDTGDAKITAGYELPAKHVIHTVGPIYFTVPPEEAAQLLESCYKVSLQVAVKNDCETIAFPSISTGAYGYPIRDATEVALRTVRDFLEQEEGTAKLKRVVFTVFSSKDLAVYQELLPSYFPPVETPGDD